MDFPLSSVRKVTLHWIERMPTSFLVAESDVNTFIEATKRLHWKPGRNPHNNVECSKVWQITVATMELRGPFWWTVPDLQKNDDPRGARIIEGGIDRAVWTDEEYVNRLRAEEAEAEAEHYRELERKAREAKAGAT
jgi:hypothetical protein